MNTMTSTTIPRESSPDALPRDLFALLDGTAAQRPDARALDFMGRTMTYRELHRTVERVAAGLQDLGVKKGDRVGLSLPNTPYSVIFFFAVQRLGAIVVNLNPLYVQHEVKQILIASGVSVLVLSDLKAIAQGTFLATEKTQVRHIVVCPFAAALPPVKSILFRIAKAKDIWRVPEDERIVPYSVLARSDSTLRPVAIDPSRDVAVLQFTGGTTGTPKAAMLTHGNLLSNIQQVQGMVREALAQPPVTLGILPLFHVFALMAVMLLTVVAGGEIVLLPRFDAKTTLGTLRRTRVSILPAVPTILTALLREKALTPDLFTHMRAVISGGAPLPVALRKRFEETARCPVVEGYGLSETSPVLTLNPLGAVRDGSCGKIVMNTDLQIRSLDNVAEQVPQGQKGEVCVRGPQVMPGYWRGDEIASPFTEDGYFRTGDVGYVDADGYLFLVDRLKDIIICGGYNVYPHAIEEALHKHPAVLETIVLGVPDSYRGQAPKAFVVLRPGARATAEELATHLEEYLSKIERPKEIVFRDTLPKTLIGKLSRKDLMIQEGLTSS
ncbi:long-chain-fatty-acid--CoA ligase [Acidomonas methanolica]|uniref:Fatty-acid (Long-chain)--CoA ligase n=1 Tax=Acidomonas methanolica NBRC 104435 TaxID=1231351 RepID=A0A023D261_ACIMT|nr:long-chain fatty acid--CoA ligase [Acidomonas methanolica]TCS30663.1 long-chain acyl-CoA synthetase [Acidomonas methanolica]GAJ28207.1 fatty-acid (long-chain)--CoA ligase [Acidomonas methanolica NBRC 104435]GBQ58502.1 acyl-CoA synthetase [Acidomonas methanolica]GEK98949.1 dicarboxylate--CoA ligase PimA [Acidomonas methanolica NBRC 104435]